MATSVAHGLVGIVVYCAVRSMTSEQEKMPLNPGMLLLVAMVANVPDLDMIVSLMLYGDHRVLHGGLSHTVLFAVIAGFMVWLRAKHSANRMVLSIMAALVLLSHVLVDLFTGPNIGLSPTHGATPLWPVIETRIIFPLTLFKGVEHTNILPNALLTAFWEFVLLMPVTAMIVYWSAKKDLQN